MKDKPLHVVLVEDNPGDIELVRNGLALLETKTILSIATDGEEALALLRRQGTHSAAPRPDLVLLDLKIPRKSGLEVLEEVKADATLRTLPVVVLTSSKAPADVARTYALQATACFAKPLRGMSLLLKSIIEFVAAATPPAPSPSFEALQGGKLPVVSNPPGVPRDAELAAIVKCATEAIISLENDGTIRSWNAAAERLYGYTAKEALGRNVRLIVPQERIDDLHQQMQAVAEDASVHLETVRINREGREVEVGLTVSPIRDENGRLVGRSVIARDISERRQVERKFRLAVESSASAMVMVDAEGKIVLVNAETERQFGYLRQDLVGKAIEMLVPERFRDLHPGNRASFASRPATRAMGAGRDLFGLRSDGTEFPVEIGLNPIHMPDGVFVLASVVDITERKQAEERFRLAVEASPSGIAMVDEGGDIVLVNAETERMFGYAREELIGKQIDALVPTRYQGQHRLHREGFHAKPRKRVMGSGRDLFGLRKDGTEFPVEIGLNPIRTGEGLVTLSTIVDITERKLAESALTRQTEELERSNADLEQFAYVASHDLQEPLRMVASYTDLLSEYCGNQLDEKAHAFVRYAQDGASRMQRLIDDLLSYSRVRTQRSAPHPVDSRACVDHALANLSISIAESGADIQVGHLPSVLADETQLTEVFQNLVHNAIKFRSDAAPRIRIMANVERALCIFRVTDNGIGIPRSQAQRVFQVFQRLHTRDEYPGTGIGLALCKRVVEQYGGEISVESNEDRGSTFTFSMPAV